MHEEASGKHRLIANGRGCGHHAWTSGADTLYAIGTSFAAEAAYAVTAKILEHQSGISKEEMQNRAPEELAERLPEWASCGLGCEDMTDAFRQCPVAPDHQGANVVGYFSVRHDGWGLRKSGGWSTACEVA